MFQSNLKGKYYPTPIDLKYFDWSQTHFWQITARPAQRNTTKATSSFYICPSCKYIILCRGRLTVECGDFNIHVLLYKRHRTPHAPKLSTYFSEGQSHEK